MALDDLARPRRSTCRVCGEAPHVLRVALQIREKDKGGRGNGPVVVGRATSVCEPCARRIVESFDAMLQVDVPRPDVGTSG